MKQFWILLLLGLARCDAGKGSSAPARSPADPITVYAASSLTEAVDSARRTFRIPLLRVRHRGDEVLGLTDRALRREAGRWVASGPCGSLLRPPGNG